MIGDSVTRPVLLYDPDEKRGWLVPQFSVLECMTALYIENFKFSDNSPPKDLNLKSTKQLLLDHIKHPTLKPLLSVDNDEAKTNLFGLREVLNNISNALEWAEEQARHTRRKFGIIGDDIIYGLEFYKLALRDPEHKVKKCEVNRPHGNWVELLNGPIKGVVFCNGLGEVIIGEGTSCKQIPQDHGYVAAVIPCLEYLRKHDRFDAGFQLKFESAAFEQCSSGSFESHLQIYRKEPAQATYPTHHPKGVVVFGERQT